MRQLGEFLLVNVLLLGLIVIGAGCFWITWSAVESLHLSLENQSLAIAPGCFLATLATYYAGKFLHALINKHLINRR